MAINIININGLQCNPSVLEIGIQDVSAPDAGRDLTGTMHPMKIGEKQTVQLEWWEPDRTEVKNVLSRVRAESFPVSYYDPNTDTWTTKTMYVGDRQVPIRMWGTDSQGNVRAWYSKMSFKLIEI